MATRNFVPRADGEGKLGTPSKKWGDVYATTIHGALDGTASSATIATDATNDADGNPISSTYVKKDSDYLGYRQPSTAYAVGAMAYHATLPTGWYLECTTAGKTGSGTLTITSPTVGGTVSDGTVTWTVMKNLPLSGGAVMGTNITRNVDDSILRLVGGTLGNGATLLLTGKDYSQLAAFNLVASDGQVANTLAGYTDGRLTWKENDLGGSAIVAKSIGYNGYIKYASGLILQYGEASLKNANGVKRFFPITFSSRCQTFAIIRDVGANHDSATMHLMTSGLDGYIVYSTLNNEAYNYSWFAIGY